MVRALLLITASTSHITVCRHSSFSDWSFRRLVSIFPTVLICRSQIPQWCDPAGGLKIQVTPLCSRASGIWDWFPSFIARRISCSVATGFVPLSGRDVVNLGQDSRMLCVFWQGCPVQSSTNPENPILEEGIQFHDRTTSLDLFTFLQSAKLLTGGVTLAELNDQFLLF